MDTESKDIVQEQIKKLPKEVRDALASDELSTKIRAVGNNHHLHIDQIGTMEDEVILAIMGISDASELSDQLMKQLSISKMDADAIVNDINTTVFMPIQESMKKSDTKSVVMPSTIAAAQAAASVAPTPAPIVSTPTPTAPIASTDMQINAPEKQDAIAAPAVAMPSATTPTPVVNTPAAVAPAPTATPTAVPNIVPSSHEVDIQLSEPTVSMPKKDEAPVVPTTTTPSASSGQAAVPNITTKVEPPKAPPIYKADPYREPIE
jgi:hypothetical protein